jgi:L-lactate utilization protein LutB
MTRLPGDTLREKLEKGEINSETERSEVTKMKGSSSARAPACKDPWEKVLTKIDAFIKEVTTKAKADGLTALEMAEVTANKEEIVKRLNALIVNLKHFEKKGK